MKHQLSLRSGAVLAAATLAVTGLAGPAQAGQAGAGLVVRAVDAATGAPVSGFCADVSTKLDGGICTDGSEAVFDDLPAGSAEVSVTGGTSGYALPSAGVPVTLAEGETTSVSVPVTLGGRVTTTAVDRATGRPVAGACVVLVVPGRGGLPDRCDGDTDEAGRVTTYPVAAGTYQMFVYAPEGYGHQWVGPYGGTGDQREAALIRVRAGRPAAASTVRLDRPGTVGGVVRDPDGTPAAGVDVDLTAWHFGVGPAHSVTTDEQGRYVLGQLGPYSWPLVFTPGGAVPRQWSGGVANRFQADRARVRPGASSTYDMRLVRGSVLRGAVTVRDGATADSWRITAVDAATGDRMGVNDSTVAGDRDYAMPLAGPQQAKITWDARIGDQDRTGWWRNATDITTATPVPVPRSGVRTLNLTIE